jgi:tetratricopeptide (TPR) repeat protein
LSLGLPRAIARDIRARRQIALLEETIRREPNNASALRELAGFYLERGRDDEAFRYAQKSVAIEAESLDSWITYGVCGETVLAQAKSEQERHQALTAVKESGERLHALCLKMQETGKEPSRLITAWSAAAHFLEKGGEHRQAVEAYRLAIESARKLGQSQDPGERRLGQDYIKILLVDDPWKLGGEATSPK